MGQKNKELIRKLMKHKGRRGNFKDYVVLSGELMHDYQDKYVVQRVDGRADDDTKLLLHKRWLYQFIRKEQAEAFWNRKLRVRLHPFRRVDEKEKNS